MHFASRKEYIMIWSNQSPLLDPLLETLRQLDGRNLQNHPVV